MAHGRFEELGENLFAGDGAAADAGTAHLGADAFGRSPREHAAAAGPTRRASAPRASHGKLVVVEDFAIKMGAADARRPVKPVPPVNPIVASDQATAPAAR